MIRPNHRIILMKVAYYWYERPNSDYYFELHELWMAIGDAWERRGVLKIPWHVFA